VIDKSLRVFFWPASSEDGTFLYRIKMQWEMLAALGHEVGCSQRLPDTIMAKSGVVVGQRIATPGPLLRWQQMLARRAAGDPAPHLVYELDDDLLAINTHRNPLGQMLRSPEQRRVMVEAIRSADLVTVSTEPLAKSMSRLNRKVVVLPNALPPQIMHVPLSTRRGTNPVLIGWQGSHTHEFDWLLIRDVVAQVLGEHPNVLMRFLGMAYPDKLPRGKLSHRPWTTDLDLHYRRSAAFDIGLAPLENNQFNRAKSGLKFMEGAALGVPMVCSRVPAYQGLVEHGVTGFLASTPAQWYEYLSALVEDPGLRVSIGDAAREAAREWTMDSHIHCWEDAYASLLEG
jgi:glycosyltransferase involved in cell wall biosynthesis